MKVIVGMTTETVAGPSYAPHWVGYAIVAVFVLIIFGMLFATSEQFDDYDEYDRR